MVVYQQPTLFSSLINTQFIVLLSVKLANSVYSLSSCYLLPLSRCDEQTGFVVFVPLLHADQLSVGGGWYELRTASHQSTSHY